MISGRRQVGKTLVGNAYEDNTKELVTDVPATSSKELVGNAYEDNEKVHVGNVHGVDEARVVELIQAHVEDPTPHPAYDNLVAGRFVVFLKNGMS